ncbi:Glycosyl transferase, family 2 OS=Crocosphaera watsonii WH 8502 GN=CWATWH8502_1802 PE=4 SV=1: Glycos_transf_2 [Gemmataceae bacterium]|nr:Glycosyl transferase, family 2 OS=Crocosphaera watsonii WH 8502 GN=CWATWH8502_1802 PE=4 SV=1: Glycos_transf_2 [Gemmataceae bacterium]VTT97520.1 Glycosyl transferase, family 2 OS=Crocosphaera watsonii WH 8502 GN=CWATWH8502_1802 PE=4 SV=1: Glycos_transf_2 [Gemmataceae bacterium]
MATGLTVVVPAWNEERRLAVTVGEVVAAARRHLGEFEVIVVDDGSTDGTPAVARKLAAKFPCVSVVRHETNLGVGAAFHTGLTRARFPYLSLVPGDNAFHESGLDAVFALVGKVEMVVTYRANPRARTPMRRLLSVCCTRAMRLVTGRPIRDAHSLYVFPVAQARQVRRNTGYGYHIETLSTLLRGGVPFAEVPVQLNPRPDSSSKVMRLGVLARLMATMGRQFLRFVVLREKVRFAPVAAATLTRTRRRPFALTRSQREVA